LASVASPQADAGLPFLFSIKRSSPGFGVLKKMARSFRLSLFSFLPDTGSDIGA
jgi:hypothetical protein